MITRNQLCKVGRFYADNKKLPAVASVLLVSINKNKEAVSKAPSLSDSCVTTSVI